MLKLHKKFLAVGAAILIVLSLILLSNKTEISRAAPPGATLLYGWLWSSNIGWISLNSANPGAGSGAAYSVGFDGNGYLNGWAWSPNIGWVGFGSTTVSVYATPPSSGSPNAQPKILDINSNSNVIGWARACAGATVVPATTAYCSSSNSGNTGWDGWIELAGTNHELKYKYTSPGNATIEGFAWGSNVVGWLQFVDVKTTVPTGGGSSLMAACSGAKTGSTNLDHVQWTVGATGGTGPYVYTFLVNNVVGQNGLSNTFTSPTSGSYTSGDYIGTALVTDGVGATFTAQCGTVGFGTTGGNNNNNTPPAIIMWLNNDTNEKLSSIKLKSSSAVYVNWKKTAADNFSACEAKVKTDNVTNTMPNFDTPPINGKVPERPNGSAYLIPGTEMTVGVHTFFMSCDSVVSGNTIQGKTNDGNQSAVLKIQIISPTIEER